MASVVAATNIFPDAFDALTGQTAARASRQAGQQQADAISNGMGVLGESYGAGRDFLSEIYGENQGVFDPYIEAGESGIRTLADLVAGIQAGPGEFEASPGYQFRRDQGLDAVQRQAANRRSPYGSAATKSMADFSGNLASQEYGNFFDRWLTQQGAAMTGAGNIADRGLRGAGGKAGFAGNIGNAMAGMYGSEGQTMADLWTQMGNAQAAGTVGSGNALSQGWQNILSAGSGVLGGWLGGRA